MSSLPTILGLYLLFFITFSNVHAYGTKCSPVGGDCYVHWDCCSGVCHTYGSKCGSPPHRLIKTYLSPSEVERLKRIRQN